MKILRAHIENYRRISMVEIDPQSAVVQITGRNMQGKSSLLDSVEAALSKADVSGSDPVRRGAKKARIVLHLGTGENVEVVVTREMIRREKTDGTIETVPTLKIELADGSKVAKPVTYLDELVGALTMDPMEFMGADPKEQAKLLRGFVSGFDFDAAAKASKEDYDARKDLNREIKQIHAQADAIIIPLGTPAAPVDVEAIDAEIEAAISHNADLTAKKAQWEMRGQRIEMLRRQADEAKTRADNLRAQAATEDQNHAVLLAEAANLESATPQEDGAPVDVADLRIARDKARAINSAVERRRQKTALIQQAEEKEAESDRLTKAIQKRQDDAMAAIAAAGMPVEGLTIDGDEVKLNGLPLHQASSAEQIRTSVAIAMKLNPKLRVLRIKDGDKLDDDAVAIIAGMAADNDFQVWMEMVRGAGANAIVIEDGAVATTLV